MRISFIMATAILFFLISGLFGGVRAYSLSEPQAKNITNGVNGLVNEVLKGFAPGGSKDIVNSANSLVAPSTPKIASGGYNFFNNFSTDDITTPIKAVLTLMINLFFVVIQVVIDILRALLGAISTSPH